MQQTQQWVRLRQWKWDQQSASGKFGKPGGQ